MNNVVNKENKILSRKINQIVLKNKNNLKLIFSIFKKFVYPYNSKIYRLKEDIFSTIVITRALHFHVRNYVEEADFYNINVLQKFLKLMKSFQKLIGEQIYRLYYYICLYS